MFRIPPSLVSIKNWIALARQNPAAASHPGNLQQLDKNLEAHMTEAAKYLPFAALHAPAAPRTAGIRAILTGAVRETGSIPWDASRPVTIVGMRAGLSIQAAGGTNNPGSDDIDVDFTVDERDRMTSSRDASAGLAQTGWVSLGSLSVATPRLLLLRIDSPAPRLNFNFRWSDPNLNRFHDTIIKLDLFVIYDDDHREG